MGFVSPRRECTMNQLEEILEFEEEEVKRFLATYFPFVEVQEKYFSTIDQAGYSALMEKSKKGIQDGVEDYLKRNHSGLRSIYLIGAAGIRAFCLNENVKEEIRRKVQTIPLVGSLDDYCDEVGGKYGAFLYGYSRKEFQKRFTLPVQRAYG